MVELAAGRTRALVLVGLVLGAGCGNGSGTGAPAGGAMTDAGADASAGGGDAGMERSSTTDAGPGAADGPEDIGPLPIPPGLSLLAGGLGGTGNADDTAGAARFASPFDVTSDGAGNLFVTDSGGHTIRKIVIATGAVTTVAGSPGLSGSADGTGAAARFTNPLGLASDGAGNVFVADSSNATIRKIVLATGAVTTLAGSPGLTGTADGTGAAARFSGPKGVASDGAGNLFVTDDGRTVRQIVAATGAVTTLAGSPLASGVVDGVGSAAAFNLPGGPVSDHAGNLYVADAGGRTIRKIVVATATVTTIAGGTPGSADGTGRAARFDDPVDLAYDFAGNLFVLDTGTIRKIVLATAVVTTLAGSPGQVGSVDATGAGARFSKALGLTSDGAGNVFVADTNNFTVRRVVTGTGTVTTLAGAPPTAGTADGRGAQARFLDPSSLLSDGAGNLYVSERAGNVIRRIEVATRAVTTLAGAPGQSGSADGTGDAARFDVPQDLALQGADDLYVADYLNDTIRKVAIATGVVTTIAGAAGSSGSADGTGAAARFSLPLGLATDGGGNLYVSDAGNRTIRKIVLATGAVTTLAGSAGVSGAADGTGSAASFGFPGSLAFDGHGDLFVSDRSGLSIRKIVLATGVVTTLAGTAGQPGTSDGVGPAARFLSPWGLVSDGADTLYVADNQANTVRKIAVGSGAVTTMLGVPGRAGVLVGPLPGGLNFPIGVALQPDGVLFVTSENAVLAAR